MEVEYIPGLKGVPAAKTEICMIDTDAGEVWIRGYSLKELAVKAPYEEIAYLLLYGRLPRRKELDEFSKLMRDERPIPESVKKIILGLPDNASTMDMLRTGLSAVASYDPELEDNSVEANRRKAVRIISKMGTLIGVIAGKLAGRQPLEPDPKLSHAENILYMITDDDHDEFSRKTFKTIFSLYVEHGLAASTFTARVIASTLSDIYGAIVGAIAALKGPLHGRAMEKALEMILPLRDEEEAERKVLELLARKERVMGFGHRIYKTGVDPRAKMLKEVLREFCDRIGDDRLYRISVRMEEVMMREKGLYPNVDFYAGQLYHLLGIPTELFTPLFAASRSTGWSAHVVEQQADNVLFRPKGVYVGKRGLGYKPIEERELGVETVP